MSTEETLHIPLPYIILTLYVEPLFAFFGAISAIFTPASFLHDITSITTDSPPPASLVHDPFIHTILTNLAGCYILFAALEAVVLRMPAASPQKRSGLAIWKSITFAQALSDIAHLAALAPFAAPEIFEGKISSSSTVAEVLWALRGYWRFWSWTPIAWGNVGFLWVILSIYISCLCKAELGTYSSLFWLNE